MTSTGVSTGVLTFTILTSLIIGTEIGAIFIYPVYKRAGARNKWLVFIPVLSTLPLFDVARLSRWWYLPMLCLETATVILRIDTLHSPSASTPFMYYVFYVLSFAFSFYVTRRVLKGFGVSNWVAWLLLIMLICELFMRINLVLTMILSLIAIASAVVLIVYWCRMAWGALYYDGTRISS